MVKNRVWSRLDLDGNCRLFSLDSANSQKSVANVADFQSLLVVWNWNWRLERR